jgi:hypothetical protein
MFTTGQPSILLLLPYASHRLSPSLLMFKNWGLLLLAVGPAAVDLSTSGWQESIDGVSEVTEALSGLHIGGCSHCSHHAADNNSSVTRESNATGSLPVSSTQRRQHPDV